MGHRLLVSPRRLSQRGMSRRGHTLGNRLRGLRSPGSTQRVSREASQGIRAFPFPPYERGKVTRHSPSRFSYTLSVLELKIESVSLGLDLADQGREPGRYVLGGDQVLARRAALITSECLAVPPGTIGWNVEGSADLATMASR